MRFTIVLPAGLSDTGSEVFTVTAWRKEIGDLVQQGESVATVKPLDADAVGGGQDIEVTSSAFGILARKSVLEGDGIESGEPLGVLSGVPESLTPPTDTDLRNPFATPVYVPAGPEEALVRTVADQMLALHNARSLRTAPHVTTVTVVDLGEVMRLRERVAKSLTEREGIALDLLPFVLSVTGDALREYPLLNAQLREKADEIRVRQYVNLAFTTRTSDNRLTAPVIREPHKMSILGLARTVADLRSRAESNRLRPDEVRGATFTITQAPVSDGVLWQTPIIHQPQAAILSLGNVVRTPAVREDDSVVVRPVLHLCLSHDARIVDEESAGQFLAAIKKGLEEAQFLFA